jgi:chemotaxis protein methyltransferase CheR
LLKWFQQEGVHWQLDNQIRGMVSFSQLNLASYWPPMALWDLIFLRNVMIYFDNEVKKQILSRVARVLSADGYLLLGGAETTLSLDASFTRIESLKAGFYQLKPRPNSV